MTHHYPDVGIITVLLSFKLATAKGYKYCLLKRNIELDGRI